MPDSYLQKSLTSTPKAGGKKSGDEALVQIVKTESKETTSLSLNMHSHQSDCPHKARSLEALLQMFQGESMENYWRVFFGLMDFALSDYSSDLFQPGLRWVAGKGRVERVQLEIDGLQGKCLTHVQRVYSPLLRYFTFNIVKQPQRYYQYVLFNMFNKNLN
ncbi:hypothetical protein BT96DRAFT_947089 [Gymnopus androsaceus JB14]|uniref:Uncharacterized protein n=1 Tax=Gymnopus androsaceus JB14 TaxID=1447944 RepID=A0A6A4GVR4_9AGAR|nr:hypothetical protein BT96DRAFT_947089 [Gymnopus androsaceus JB14]